MRILIYSETEEAKALQSKVKADGHASLRNPQYFSASEVELCDKVYTDDEEIAAAYKAREIKVEPITKKK